MICVLESMPLYAQPNGTYSLWLWTWKMNVKELCCVLRCIWNSSECIVVMSTLSTLRPVNQAKIAPLWVFSRIRIWSDNLDRCNLCILCTIPVKFSMVANIFYALTLADYLPSLTEQKGVPVFDSLIYCSLVRCSHTVWEFRQIILPWQNVAWKTTI